MSVFRADGFKSKKTGYKDNLVSYLIKPAVSAGIGGFMTHYMHPNQEAVILGKRIPRWALSGAAFGLGTIAADLAHDHIYPHILKSKKFQHVASQLTAAGVNTATVYGLHALINAKAVAQLNVGEIATEAAIITIASDYITDRWILPMIA